MSEEIIEDIEETTIEFAQGATGKKSCRVKVKKKNPEEAFAKARELFKSAINNIENSYE